MLKPQSGCVPDLEATDKRHSLLLLSLPAARYPPRSSRIISLVSPSRQADRACCGPHHHNPDLDARPYHFDSHLIWLQLQVSRDILAELTGGDTLLPPPAARSWSQPDSQDRKRSAASQVKDSNQRRGRGRQLIGPGNHATKGGIDLRRSLRP